MESKYLLVGLASCGVCGSGLSVRCRNHGSKRAYYYVCTGYHLRGRTVCTNKYELPMEATDAAVLDEIGHRILSTDMLATAVDRAVQMMSARASDEGATEHLHAARRALDEELSRLTEAVAAGGPMSTLVEAIRERESRRRVIDSRLATLDRTATLSVITDTSPREQLQDRADDWRGALGRNTEQARQLLRKVLVGR